MGFSIRKAAVLGAGVMGSGIASHLANAGVPVLLLDIVPPNPSDSDDTSSKAFRNKFAASALKKLPKASPPALTSKKSLELIEVGNFDDDLGRLSECDWVIEVVKEDLSIKQSLFAKVEAAVTEGTIVSSNTSGLSIKGMLEGRSESFKSHFLVTHFFNPVRWMRLLELVSGEETRDDVVEAIHKFGEERLGKGIVYGKDTTNFIANRIGVYGMMKTMAEMQKAELSVGEVDAIFGPAMGRPKSAVFRTADVVGLDTFVHVSQNCYDSLPDDEERDVFAIPDYIHKMVENKMLGSKSGGGFYRKSKNAEGKRVIQSLDFATFEYKDAEKVRFDSIGAARGEKGLGNRIAKLMKGEDKAAKFAESVTLATLAYASRRIPEIADDLVNIDRGMRWGFGWEMGPFETWDAYGVADGVARMEELGLEPGAWVKDMLAAGRTSFYAVENAVDTYWDITESASTPIAVNARTKSIGVLKRTQEPVAKNDSATLYDMGDGVAVLEFHTKMNSINQGTVEMLNQAIDIAERDFVGLVIGNDAKNFSAGADLMSLLWAANAGSWDQIEQLIDGFQAANQRARYSSIPVVTCPVGFTFGGGAECMLSGNAVQAASDAVIGLVEVGVGLIPGGAGNLQLLRNVYGPVADDKSFDALPYIQKVFMTIGMAHVCTSAEEAMERGFLKTGDGISMNRDFVLSDAKARVLGMAASFMPPRETKFRLPGESGTATVDMLLYDMELNGNISAHDRLIGRTLAGVLCGGSTSPGQLVSEQDLLDLEKEAFLKLCGEEKSRARMQHMLTAGKPLRN